MRKKLAKILCENPNCKTGPFEPLAPNQKTCRDPRCIKWKYRQNRIAYREKHGIGRKIPQPDQVCMPTRGDGCTVGSILWCPFPGIENW